VKYRVGVEAAPAPSVPELASRLRLDVMRLARKLRRQADAGLSPSLLSALSTVDRQGPITIGGLSDAEQVRPPTMTKVVSGLVAQGLVSRRPDPLDGRVAWIVATPQGRRLLRQSRTRSAAYLARRMRDLDPGDLLVLERAGVLLAQLTEDRA
jgi:DNA-binding MarR family transcriptional regulator